MANTATWQGKVEKLTYSPEVDDLLVFLRDGKTFRAIHIGHKYGAEYFSRLIQPGDEIRIDGIGNHYLPGQGHLPVEERQLSGHQGRKVYLPGLSDEELAAHKARADRAMGVF